MNEKIDHLLSEGFEARRENRPTDALKAFAEAAALSRNAADQPLLAKALTGLGQIERDIGNNESALRHYEAAVKIYRDQGDSLKLAHTIRHVADILRHEASYEESRKSYEEALGIYRRQKETIPLDLANTLRGYALLASEHNPKQSEPFWQEAKSLYETAAVKAGVDECEKRLALLDRSSVRLDAQ
jgi:tetratricopeptide (TPR) repeat protein